MGDMNDERADWVQQAFESVPAFQQVLAPGEGGPYTAVKDFLCNLMHYCDREGIDFDDVLYAAGEIYRGEAEDDE